MYNQQVKIKALQNRLLLAENLTNTCRSRVEHLERIVEEQEADMAGLKIFLDLHDDAAPSSIAQQLSDINLQIEGVASCLAIRDLSASKKLVPHLQDGIRKRMVNILGSRFFEVLLGYDIHDVGSAALLQCGMQCVVVAWVFWLFKEQSNFLLGGLLERIREDEIQPVYGRWRCIAYRYLRLIGERKRETQDYFLTNVLYDLYLTGVSFGLPPGSHSYEEIISEYQTSLDAIAKQTIGLASRVTEAVVSKDYDITRYGPCSFHSGWMQTVFPTENPPALDEVLGTVGLGMSTLGKHGRSQGRPDIQVFRKAVVITESVLRVIMND